MQSKYKIGDRVKMIGNENPVYHYFEIGDEVIVVSLDNDTAQLRREKDCKQQTVSYPDFEPVSSAQKIMARNIIRDAVLDDDTKILIKHNVLSASLSVYSTEFVNEFLVNKFKKEMAQLLRDQEAADATEKKVADEE